MTPYGIVFPTSSADPSTPVPSATSPSLADHAQLAVFLPHADLEGYKTHKLLISRNQWENYGDRTVFPKSTLLTAMSRPQRAVETLSLIAIASPMTTSIDFAEGHNPDPCLVTVSRQISSPAVAYHGRVSHAGSQPLRLVTSIKRTSDHGPTPAGEDGDMNAQTMTVYHRRFSHLRAFLPIYTETIAPKKAPIWTTKEQSLERHAPNVDDGGRKRDFWENVPGSFASTKSRGGEYNRELLWGATEMGFTSRTSPSPAAKHKLRGINITSHDNDLDTAVSSKPQTTPPLSPAGTVPGTPRHLTSNLPSPSPKDMPRMYTSLTAPHLSDLYMPSAPTSPLPAMTPPPSPHRWQRVPDLQPDWAQNSSVPFGFNFDLPSFPSSLVWLLFLGLFLGLLGSAVLYLVNFRPVWLQETAVNEESRGRYQAFGEGSQGSGSSDETLEEPPSAMATAREFEGATLLRRLKPRNPETGASPSLPSHTTSPTGVTPLLRPPSSSSSSSSASSSPTRSPKQRARERQRCETLCSSIPVQVADDIPLLTLPPRVDSLATHENWKSHHRPHSLNLDAARRPTHPSLQRPRTSEEWIAARAAFDASASDANTPNSDFDAEAQTPQKGKGILGMLPSAISSPSSPSQASGVRWAGAVVARSCVGCLESIDGAVGKMVDRVARFTADEGAEDELILPVCREGWGEALL